MPDKTREEKKKTRESKQQQKNTYTRTRNLRQENEAICDHNIVTDENETRVMRERQRKKDRNKIMAFYGPNYIIFKS